MDHCGYSWTISAVNGQWIWVIRSVEGGEPLVRGVAPNRAVAAAMVIRAIARGVTEAPTATGSLAA